VTTARPGRGRPPHFDDHLRHTYLTCIRDGMRLGEAAKHLGIHPNTPAYHTRTDPAFAAQLTAARAAGKKARDEKRAHDEYRYNVLGCRCPKCRTAHARARTARRHTPDPQPTATIHDMPAQPSPSTSFSLAKAS
jgi:hypothetical protein